MKLDAQDAQCFESEYLQHLREGSEGVQLPPKMLTLLIFSQLSTIIEKEESWRSKMLTSVWSSRAREEHA
jgi:hypothetical protein